MMSEFKVGSGEIAGFELCGYVQPNGVIRLDTRYIKEWPKMIDFNSNKFTLENVIDGHLDDATGEFFQTAQYA